MLLRHRLVGIGNRLLPRALSSGSLQVLESINDYRLLRKSVVMQGAKEGRDVSIGFVPTMGALHQGHLSLVKKAKEENDIVVASIFVNPKQFAAHEDLDKYPRPLENDLKMLSSVGCNYVFTPTKAMMYPENPTYGTYVTIEGIDTISEGAARPGFFRGVATVVTKLLNIVQPTSAYFGQKDGLQCLVLKQIVRDLNIPVNITVLPTQREKDGLAMSSRNVYLSESQRKTAPALYQALCSLQSGFTEGRLRDVGVLREKALEVLRLHGSALEVQYISIADGDTAAELQGVISDDVASRGVFVSGAIRLGATRIIDNIVMRAPSK